MKKFNGTGVALVTPFKKEGEVDYSALEKLVEFQIQNGVYFVPKFVCKFGDKKYPSFKNRRDFSIKFEK